jgi:hypothetical protein
MISPPNAAAVEPTATASKVSHFIDTMKRRQPHEKVESD